MKTENFVKALADAVASECGLIDNDIEALVWNDLQSETFN